MSWMPAFKIGVLNAWILMLYYPLHPFILSIVDKAVGTGGIFKKMGEASNEKGQKQAYTIYMVILISLLIYSIFLPLVLGTAWFYTGLTIYFIGLILFLTSIINFATIPLGQLCTQGMYRYSRHPLYLSILITFLGVSVACASWIFFFLTAVLISVQNYQVRAEEQVCLKVFGNEYQKYMHQTPRWIGVPKPDRA